MTQCSRIWDSTQSKWVPEPGPKPLTILQRLTRLNPKPRSLGSCFNNDGEFLPGVFKKKLTNSILFLMSEKNRKFCKEYKFSITFFS